MELLKEMPDVLWGIMGEHAYRVLKPTAKIRRPYRAGKGTEDGLSAWKTD